MTQHPKSYSIILNNLVKLYANKNNKIFEVGGGGGQEKIINFGIL
jgi:hypothetical protein